MKKTDSKTNSTFAYETVTYRFDEDTLSIILNDVELGLTEGVLVWLEMVCAKARWIRLAGNI